MHLSYEWSINQSSDSGRKIIHCLDFCRHHFTPTNEPKLQCITVVKNIEKAIIEDIYTVYVPTNDLLMLNIFLHVHVIYL